MKNRSDDNDNDNNDGSRRELLSMAVWPRGKGMKGGNGLLLLLVSSLLVFSLVFLEGCYGYKPVLMMHGFAVTPSQGTYHDFDHYAQWIPQFHPGQIAIALDYNNGVDSTKPMWSQAEGLMKLIRSIIADNDSFVDGYHFVGHSQGGLMMRTVIEMMDDHNVDHFISLAGVQFGMYGTGSTLKKPLSNTSLEEFTDFLYTWEVQDVFSMANWWHTPIYESKYLKDNIFLPVINNEVIKNTTAAAQYKENFLRLNLVHLFGSPNDGTLVPWFTSLFDFWSEDENRVSMFNQTIYQEDLFGLKTLYESNRLNRTAVDGVEHSEWLSNQQLFLEYVLPLLT